MIKRGLQRVMALACLMTLKVALAGSYPEIYKSVMPVVSQQEASRQQAMQRGFKEVLTRLTVDPAILQRAEIQGALQNAESFVQSYHYQPSSSANTYEIEIQFDKDDIAQVLKKANIPFWGETRPLILVWLMATDEHGDQIIGASEPNVYQRALSQQARHDGLPIIFPMMDVTDMQMVSPKLIAQNQVQALSKAALRYHPDALLIGTINDMGHELKTHWKLVLGNKHWDFIVNDNNVEMLSALLFNQVRSTLAKQMMAEAANDDVKTVHMRVTHVMLPSDYERLTHFLEAISVVQQVQLEQVSGTTVDFTLVIQGGLSHFEENAAVGNLLELKAENDVTHQLVYQWKS